MSVSTKEKPTIDMGKVEAFAGQFINDLSANYSGVMVLIGHELGLYKAMEGMGPLTSAELSGKTNTYERYIREWLNNQAAGGYLHYDAQSKTYELPAEHALVLTQSDGPLFMTPGYSVVNSFWHDKDKLEYAFKSGKGIGWHEHNHNLFHGVEGIYRAGYKANLIDVWLPSIQGLGEKLTQGCRVADVGCGHGASAILMAEQYPNSEIYGFDYHQESVDVARARAKDKGLTNVFFEVAHAENYEEENFDLIAFFDCFHDFGHPLNSIKYAREKLAPEGVLMLVEPNASDQVEDNFNPIGRMYFAASTALCVPHSHSEEGDYCLGAQAGPSIVEKIAKEAGFSRFRIADQSPVNLVYEIMR